MNPHPQIQLSQLETECIRILWQKQAATVAQVRSAIPRPLAYTTVMTVLDRMREKGAIVRRKQGRTFLYSPALDRDLARREAVRRLLECFFDRDPQALVRFLLAQGEATSSPAPGNLPEAGRVEIDDSLL